MWNILKPGRAGLVDWFTPTHNGANNHEYADFQRSHAALSFLLLLLAINFLDEYQTATSVHFRPSQLSGQAPA